jgi:flagellar basal body-associated protein FliL
VENHPETATNPVEPDQESPSSDTPPTATEGTAADAAPHGDQKEANAPRGKKKKPPTPDSSVDPISKKMFLYSKIFALLAVICIGFLTTHYLKKKKAAHPPLVEDAQEVAHHQFEMPLLHVVLPNEQDLRVELAFECTTQAACDFIKENPEQTNDILIPVFASTKPEIYENTEQKKLLRQKIADQLNTLHLGGKVVDVNFNNLSIEGETIK